MTDSQLEQLSRRLHRFAQERDWEQFHSPKNLSMALIGECGELVEHFQWLTEEQSHALPPDKFAEVELEMADIQIYPVSYTHLTLPTNTNACRSRWSPYH